MHVSGTRPHKASTTGNTRPVRGRYADAGSDPRTTAVQPQPVCSHRRPRDVTCGECLPHLSVAERSQRGAREENICLEILFRKNLIMYVLFGDQNIREVISVQILLAGLSQENLSTYVLFGDQNVRGIIFVQKGFCNKTSSADFLLGVARWSGQQTPQL